MTTSSLTSLPAPSMGSSTPTTTSLSSSPSLMRSSISSNPFPSSISSAPPTPNIPTSVQTNVIQTVTATGEQIRQSRERELQGYAYRTERDLFYVTYDGWGTHDVLR